MRDLYACPGALFNLPFTLDLPVRRHRLLGEDEVQQEANICFLKEAGNLLFGPGEG